MNAAPDVSHVALDRHGRAWIDDTNIKVLEVVLDHLAYGWDADEIRRQHPLLSLGQIHSALAYYHDHRAHFDTEITAGLQAAGQAAQAVANSPLRRRLHAMGRL